MRWGSGDLNTCSQAMDESDDPPFRTEYAKSNRATCKLCKLSISKDSLRLARMVQVSDNGKFIAAKQKFQPCLRTNVCSIAE